MSFKFACPHCGQRIGADLEDVGEVGACPTCHNQFVVPSPPEPPPVAAVEPAPPIQAAPPKKAASPAEATPTPAPTVSVITRRGVAILALLLAIFPAINLLALGLAIYAVVRSDRPGRSGERGLAVAAVVVSGVLFIPINLAGTLAATLTGSPTLARIEAAFKPRSPSPASPKSGSHP